MYSKSLKDGLEKMSRHVFDLSFPLFSCLSAGRLFLEQVVRGMKAGRGGMCSIFFSLTRAFSEENSCGVQEETLLFFPSGFFACDGQRSGFGYSCDVGCSLWARTQ